MTSASPTRAAVLDLKEEQRAMHEGHVFLDEKCLLLAGEMLRELQQLATAERTLAAAHHDAMEALGAALARHGIDGLEVQPPCDLAAAELHLRSRSLMGVRLQDAECVAGAPRVAPSVNDSPEARDCRQAFLRLLEAAAPLAALRGNLLRLSQEYRRSVRRARALQDVLLPEFARELYGMETRLEELEQEDALAMRHRT